MLEAEPLPGTAQARLDLVHHEEDAALVADAPHALEVVDGRRVDSPFALDRLEQDGRDGRVERTLERVEIVPGHMPETFRKGLEGLVLLRLAGGVQRRQRAAVERAIRADHDVAAAATELAGELDRALVGLAAAVAEEHESPATEQLVEHGGHVLARLCREEVGHVQQRSRLLRDGIGDDGVRVAE